jgi:hypothetical protein
MVTERISTEIAHDRAPKAALTSSSVPRTSFQSKVSGNSCIANAKLQDMEPLMARKQKRSTTGRKAKAVKRKISARKSTRPRATKRKKR